MASPYPPPPGSDSYTDEKKERERWAQKYKHLRQSASSAYSGKGDWSLKDFLVRLDVAIKRKEFDDGNTASELNAIYAMDSRFLCVVNYNNYGLIDRLQNYNAKMAAKSGKYVKRVETLIKV